MSGPWTELVSFLASEVSRALEGAEIEDHNADLFELGLDSIDAVELTAAVEARFGLELDPGLVFECRTLNALAASIIEHLAPRLRGQRGSSA